MRIIFCGVTFNMVYNFCASILRAAGDTKSPLVFLLFAGILNGDFESGFRHPVPDECGRCGAGDHHFSGGFRRAGGHRSDAQNSTPASYTLTSCAFTKPQLAKILRIGLPAGIQSALFAISNVLIQSSVNSFGDVFMSGNAAASNLEGFVYVCLNAFHQSAVNFVGQNAGAKQYRRVRQTLWICLGCVTVVGLVLGSLVYVFGPRCSPFTSPTPRKPSPMA